MAVGLSGWCRERGCERVSYRCTGRCVLHAKADDDRVKAEWRQVWGAVLSVDAIETEDQFRAAEFRMRWATEGLALALGWRPPNRVRRGRRWRKRLRAPSPPPLPLFVWARLP